MFSEDITTQCWLNEGLEKVFCFNFGKKKDAYKWVYFTSGPREEKGRIYLVLGVIPDEEKENAPIVINIQ